MSHSSELFKSLINKTEMKSIGLDLSKAAGRLLVDDWVKGIPYLLLVLVVVATSYYQQKQIMARTKNQANDHAGQPAAAVAPEDHAAVHGCVLPDAAVGHDHLLPHHQLLPHRAERLHHPTVLPGQEHAAENDLPAPTKDGGTSGKALPAGGKPGPNGELGAEPPGTER